MRLRKGSKLKLIGESEARGHVLEIYQDIKQTLGVPQVNAVFQALAVYPRFLEAFWSTMRGAAQKPEFFRLADRVRAEAYTRMHNYFPIPDLCDVIRGRQLSEGARREITDTVDLYHYIAPLLLMITVAQMAAFENPIGGEVPTGAPAEHPVFLSRPLLIEEQMATPRIKRVYEDMKTVLGLPALSTGYLAFARYPDFLENYWNVLKPIALSPLYTESQTGMCDTAWALTGEFPVRVETTIPALADAGMSDDEITAVVRVVELFVDAFSQLVLNVALAKIGLEGGNGHAASPPAAPAAGQPKQAA